MTKFFKDGIIQESFQSRNYEPPTKRIRPQININSPPQILIPFFEEVVSQEQMNLKKNFVCLSQIEVNERKLINQESIYSFKEVYIKSIAEEYQVFFILIFNY